MEYVVLLGLVLITIILFFRNNNLNDFTTAGRSTRATQSNASHRHPFVS